VAQVTFLRPTVEATTRDHITSSLVQIQSTNMWSTYRLCFGRANKILEHWKEGRKEEEEEEEEEESNIG
jgi:hypothetical protein